MASDWRFNVWLFGLTGAPDLPAVGLASPARGQNPPVNILTNQPFPLGGHVSVTLPQEGVRDFYIYGPALGAGGHFPYGIAVEPDRHT